MILRELQQRLRARSEYALRLAAMNDVGRRYPSSVSKPALPRVGVFWRWVFVPLFRRVPWSFKQQAMRTFKMTAAGWPADARRFGEPWRAPARPQPQPHEQVAEKASNSGR
ncbi:MAG TPA: hypothetical protein VMU39_04835 [Solirubrobacteraceae bacterium]|nr:hypothetical protein [Solirubrobacteraceae bacterium]